MPADRAPCGGEVAGLAALGFAVCWGLPLLLSVGTGVTIAGLGLRSWLLGLGGLTAAGLWRYRRGTRCTAPGVDRAER